MPKKPSKFQPIVDALKSRPGEWALVAEGRSPGSAASFGHNIRNGCGPFTPPGAFDAKQVGPAVGPVKLYARYIGESS